MLVMVRRSTAAEHRRLLVLGGVMLGVIGLLVGLSVGIYTKAFESTVTVTLRADAAGLQLPRYGDVRYQGALVGQVREVSQDGDEAVIRLGIKPAMAREIPRDLEAEIVPTTLFGQKFVELVPRTWAPRGLEDGTTLPPDRVHTTVELGRVLGRLFPLLRAVRPADLSITLHALANALSGRGEQIGQTLERLEAYLGDLSPHLPTLGEDLRLLASVARTYELAAPDLLTSLANLTVTARTVTDQEAQITDLLPAVTGMATTGARLLEDNERSLVASVTRSRPTLRLLDKYSPVLECLLEGFHAYHPQLNRTFEGGYVKQFVTMPAPQVRNYTRRQDPPRYAEKRGPNCRGLPDPPRGIRWTPLRNGTDLDTPQGRGYTLTPGGSSSSSNASSASLPRLYGGVFGGPTPDTGRDVSTSPPARRSATAILSARTSRPTDGIPLLGAWLYAAMLDSPGPARGTA